MYSHDFQKVMDRFHSMLPAQIWLKDDSVLIGYIAEIDIKAGSFNVLGMTEDEFYTGISIGDVVGVEDIDYAIEPGRSIVLYVDDVRKGHPDVENVVIVKSVREAMYVIDYALEVGADIELIDLDHDLGDYEPFGGDAINLVYYLAEKELYYPIAVHSSNPTGRANIMAVVERYWPK